MWKRKYRGKNTIWRRTGAVLVLAAMLISVCGCTADTELSVSSEEEEVAYELPLLLPVTGDISSLGEDALWAAEYAVNEINAAGGIDGIPVQTVLFDSQNNENQVKKYAKEIAEQYRFFIGPIDSVGAAAEADIILETGTPNIAAYSYESIREQTAPYGISYMSDTTDGELEAIRKWKELNPDLEQAAVIVTKGENSQMEAAEALKSYLPELDMSVCAVVEMDLTVNQGLDAVAEALNAKADGYIVLAREGEYEEVISELRKRGVTEGRRITASFASNDFSLAQEHKDVLEGTYVWNKFDVQYEGEEWQALLQEYQEDHDGASPSTNIVPDIYNAVYAWKQSIEELELKPQPENLDGEKQAIAEWLYQSPVLYGIQGDYQWIDGNKKSAFYYFQFDAAGVPQAK